VAINDIEMYNDESVVSEVSDGDEAEDDAEDLGEDEEEKEEGDSNV
jgi:hypothetical protein